MSFRSVPVRYVVTREGHDDAEQLPTCHCSSVRIEAMIVVCNNCSTAYAINDGPAVPRDKP